jgi:hypothetical protein
MSMMKVHLSGKDEVVELVIPENGTLSFDDFDQWTRQRFQIKISSTVIYKDENKKEIIPSGNAVIYPVVHISVEAKKDIKMSTIVSSKKPSLSNMLWTTFVFLVPFTLLAMLAMSLDKSEKFHPYLGVFSSAFEDALHASGLTHMRPLLIEAYLGFITWSIAYLFVRRSLNPENPIVFEKFSADAIFGGLAQATSIILKGLLK